MTDNEIIKALERCSSKEYDACCGCPYAVEFSCGECTAENAKDVVDIINRQKAEIERLKAEVDKVNHDYILLCSDVAENRAEAIKDFAERLKAKFDRYGAEHYYYSFVDDVVREMGVDTND